MCRSDPVVFRLFVKWATPLFYFLLSSVSQHERCLNRKFVCPLSPTVGERSRCNKNPTSSAFQSKKSGGRSDSNLVNLSNHINNLTVCDDICFFPFDKINISVSVLKHISINMSTTKFLNFKVKISDF